MHGDADGIARWPAIAIAAARAQQGPFKRKCFYTGIRKDRHFFVIIFTMGNFFGNLLYAFELKLRKTVAVFHSFAKVVPKNVFLTTLLALFCDYFLPWATFLATSFILFN